MDHCEWEQVRQEMADEERRSLQLANALILTLVFAVGFMVGFMVGGIAYGLMS